MMGNGNSRYSEEQDCALSLSKFREADAAYETAAEDTKENHFARRHAALMLVLGTAPTSPNEIADVMRIALDELTKDLMLDGPVPRAVASALSNCLRAIERSDWEPFPRGEKTRIEIALADSGPPQLLVDLHSEIDKLDKLAGLLTYLANNSGGKDVQAVFFSLTNGVAAIRDTLAATLDKLMPTTAMALRPASARG